MNKLILILSILGTISCGQPKQEKSTQEVVQVVEPKIKKEEKTLEPNTFDPGYFDYSNSTFDISFSHSVSHIFSNDSLEDNFSFYVDSGNVINSYSRLVITTFQNDTIYFDKFKTADLIYGYGTYKIKSDEELLDHIIDRVFSNLDTASFIDINTSKDAILNQSLEEDYVNHDVFLDCKQNNLPLYRYSLGNESTTFLGYSEKLKKVVPIFYCC